MINSIFFAPCAWFMSYHLGAWRALKESGYLVNIKSLGGVSSGALTAGSLAAGLDAQVMKDRLIKMSEVYPGILCWGKMSRIVDSSMDELLPQNINWQYHFYGVVTNFQVALPPIGPRFIWNKSTKRDEVKNLILSSCYIPVMYEWVPKWDNKFVIDGGCFLMNLTIPNTLTISPYMEMSENVIGYVKDSDEEKILLKNRNASLLPNKEHLSEVYQCGYSNAQKWLANI